MNALLEQQLASILAPVGEVEWKHGDDRCDCTFQRIGYWQNPYLGVAHEIRLCCAWARLRELWPDLFRDYVTNEPRDWDGAADMPRALWHRQVAIREGVPLADVRVRNLPVPQGWASYCVREAAG